jgi:hypothetical protein
LVPLLELKRKYLNLMSTNLLLTGTNKFFLFLLEFFIKAPK